MALCGFALLHLTLAESSCVVLPFQQHVLGCSLLSVAVSCYLLLFVYLSFVVSLEVKGLECHEGRLLYELVEGNGPSKASRCFFLFRFRLAQ